MSAQFIIGYGGMYFRTEFPHLVPAAQATVFISEPDAWYGAHQAGLNPANCTVISRDAAIAKEVA